MRKKNLLKVFCCLLALICLLPACERKSPLLTHADDVGDLKTDYAAIDLMESSDYSIENKESETLSLVSHPIRDEAGMIANKNYTPEGTIKYFNESATDCSVYGRWRTYQVPFSETYTMSIYDDPDRLKELEQMDISEEDREKLKKLKIHSESRVTYYAEGNTIEQFTGGHWSKAVHHCNNVVELYGDLSELRVCFNFTKGTLYTKGAPYGPPARSWKNAYAIHGNGKDHVIIALVDGEIRTEGMVGNYTVTRRSEAEGMATTFEYNQNGKLLHTEEEDPSRQEFGDFRAEQPLC